jgi:hypothetical protein
MPSVHHGADDDQAPHPRSYGLVIDLVVADLMAADDSMYLERDFDSVHLVQAGNFRRFFPQKVW